MKTIGLLGGMSWVSTEHYYRRLNEQAAQRLGGDSCAALVVWQTDFARITAHQRAGEWDAAGEILAKGARSLAAADAEIIGIGANTMHLVAPAVIAALATAAPSAVLVHIVEAVRDVCVGRGVTRLGLLGTSYTMESPVLYPPVLAAAGIDVITPNANERAEIQRITFEELIHNRVNAESRNTFRRIATELATRGANAVALACTEHGMVLANGDLDVAVLDSTQIHVDALIAAAFA